MMRHGKNIKSGKVKIRRYLKKEYRYLMSFTARYFARFVILLFKLPVIIVVAIGLPSTLSKLETCNAAIKEITELIMSCLKYVPVNPIVAITNTSNTNTVVIRV